MHLPILLLFTSMILPRTKKSMSWYFTAAINGQKFPEASIHFSDSASEEQDLSVGRNWMEHLENQEVHGYPGAYDVLRCDLIKTSTSPSANFKVWGQDYHLNRLEKSYKVLTNHILQSNEKRDGIVVQPSALKAAHEESSAIMNTLLKKMVEHEESHVKIEAQDHDVVCEIIRVTLLWTPLFDDDSHKIFVRGHASASGQIMDPNATPKYIVATVALPNNCSSSQSGGILNELPDRHISPHAKISSWSSKRRPLEKKETFMPGGVAEVLLIEENNTANKQFVLEGLTSNFFAIYRDGSICTAPDGVLLGYVRHLILECAETCDLRVDERPIDLNDGAKGLWAETFITSSSRLIYPINKILIPDYEVQIENEGEGLNWKTYWELDDTIDTKYHKWHHLLSEILKRGGY